MRICTLSSGSSGNSIFIQSDEAKILVDCGLTGKQAVESLKQIDIDPCDIDAILVTHEHIDHVKGVGVLSRKFNIPIIANENTWKSMDIIVGKIANENKLVFKTNSFFRFKDLDVQNISTFHDALDPVFFIFYKGKEKISILTDTGIVTPLMIDSIKGSDLYILESNHDIDMLLNGPYPLQLKHRIKGQYGHLSNDDCAEIVKEILKGNGERIVLGHLSRTNNTDIIAYENIKNIVQNMGFEIGKDLFLDVAKEFIVGNIFEIGGSFEY